MGTKYSSQTASGYNSTPPPDDGTVSEENKVKWSTIKTKLTDPVSTLAAAINSALTTHFNVGPTALTSNTTLGVSHYNQIIQVSGSGVTLSLTDAATLGAGWFCCIVNTDASNNVTLGRNTGGDTINGTAANITIYAKQSMYVFVNAAATGFITTYDVSTTVARFLTTGIVNTVSIASTDASATQWPALVIDRNSASPAASDQLATIDITGRNGIAATIIYAGLRGTLSSPTTSAESGQISLRTIQSGTFASRLVAGNGIQIGGAPAGGDTGAGTLNATALYVAGALANGIDVQTFTGSGTWNKPSAYGANAYAIIEAWGAGGGGGRSGGTPHGAGGGGGGYVRREVLLSTMGTTETITVGAAGTGRITSPGVGIAGGNTTVGSLITAYGGGGGSGFGSGTAVGGGGAGELGAGTSGADGTGGGGGNIGGGTGTITTGGNALTIWGGGGGSANSTAGHAVFGGGGGAGEDGNGTDGTAGTSLFGGSGGAVRTAGTQPGGGGGGADNANAGDGGAGKVIITVINGA